MILSSSLCSLSIGSVVTNSLVVVPGTTTMYHDDIGGAGVVPVGQGDMK